MEYRIGLDIGIGSVGWAVVSAEGDGHPARIEDFGVRIFDSGENVKAKASLCQERRSFRSVRRLERRRVHRKVLLRNHFQKIQMLNPTFHDDLAACKDTDVYMLKVAALERKLSPAEIYKCLVHTCNHRGYRDFYEPEEDDEEAGKNETAANEFEKAYRASGLRTVSEYLLKEYANGNFVKYRNRSGGEMHMLIRRSILKEEAEAILQAQSAYYPGLNPKNCKDTVDIIFAQRDFEDGPGDPSDNTRRYHGFLETLGQCPYYKDRKRGFRGTVIADVFAVTNTLSQYRFVDNATGEYTLAPAVANELVDFLLINAKLTMTDVKAILKKHGYTLYKSENSDDKALGKAVKFLKIAKDCLDDKWGSVIVQEQFDPQTPSDLHRIGELISTYQTPSRRKSEMKKAGIDESIIKAFASKKISGTASTSYAYMCDAIHAFLNGDIYGNFQARTIQEHSEEAAYERFAKLPPKAIDDPEIRDNRVVFKAVNETRKIVNAIIDIYGAPTEIVVEVASELGQSFQMRGKETKRQRDNEKENDRIKGEIAKLLSIDAAEVKPDMMDRYKLFQEQSGKCAYSFKPLGEMKDVLLNRNHEYEVDHIVPFSLILDNTLHNKALVFAGENQRKGQRTPLMYLDAEHSEMLSETVRRMYSRKDNPISKKKYEYYMMASLYGEEAREKLENWKSRNINDTRYITKYICGILEKNLIFAGDKKQHVHTVKGSISQKFRREWLRTTPWGDAEKNRETYLNHALDALVCANLTRPYIEIGSDAMKLRSIFFANRKQYTNEYYDYQGECIEKMKKYYGFREDYTAKLLRDPHKIPSFLPRLVEEVRVRFNDTDEELFARETARLYGSEADFIVPPHMPLTSHKQEKKFSGAIADANPIRVEEIDGELYKINRIAITDLKKKQLPNLRTDDKALIAHLETVFAGKKEEYSIADFMKEKGLQYFTAPNGQIIRKVSVLQGKVSNYYRKDIDGENYTMLGGLKYYCVEVYKDAKGATRTCGVRFVDIVKKDGKLWRKRESLPEDYAEHVMYLQPNDYIQVTGAKGEVKFEGYYKAVYTINQGKFYFELGNQAEVVPKGWALKDKLVKLDISVLGHKGGQIHCSEPLPFIGEKK